MTWNISDTTNNTLTLRNCPVCSANDEYSLMEKKDRITEDYIGKAWECTTCEWWEPIE